MDSRSFGWRRARLSNHCAGHANSVADIAAAIVQGACSVYFATTESADIGESNGTEGGEPNAALRDPANSSTQMCLEQLAALVHRAAGHGSLARVGLCSAVAARLASLVLDGPADGKGDGSDHGMTAAWACLFVVLGRRLISHPRKLNPSLICLVVVLPS